MASPRARERWTSPTSAMWSAPARESPTTGSAPRAGSFGCFRRNLNKHGERVSGQEKVRETYKKSRFCRFLRQNFVFSKIFATMYIFEFCRNFDLLGIYTSNWPASRRARPSTNYMLPSMIFDEFCIHGVSKATAGTTKVNAF